MKRLSFMFFMTVFGWAGWWLGDKIGIWTAFILSSIGTFAGVYVGWWINQNYLD